jgi:tRNA(Ile)-lysidine synthase
MPPENNAIIRPFLDFSKEDLKSYAKEHSIEWREDVSNESSKYRRNLLRNVVLPELETAIPTLNESVITLVKQFQLEQKELEREVELLQQQILDDRILSVKTLRLLSDFALIELFRGLEQSPGIALEVKKLNHKGTKVVLSPSTKHDFMEAVFDGGQISFVAKNEALTPHLQTEEIDALPMSFSKNEIYLDKAKIKGELIVRKWEIGDRIASIGMEGTQLISDVISNAKLNAHEKARVFVVCDEVNVHWCIGLKVGRLAIAQNDSDVILKCWI